MKTIKKLKKEKTSTVLVDESLDKYDDVVLFPGKLAKAKEMLRAVGLPKESKKHHHASH